MVRFQLMFLKLSSLDRAFQDLSYGILYVSVAQIFVSFLICIYRGKSEWKYKVFHMLVYVISILPFAFFQNYFSRKL